MDGWMVKEVMNLIYNERTGVKYHEVHIYRLLHKWGFSPKVPTMRFVNAAASKQDNKNKFRKRQEGQSQIYLKDSLLLLLLLLLQMNPSSYMIL